MGAARALSVLKRVTLLGALACASSGTLAQGLTFSQVLIDPNNPSNPHCKTTGDIDGDGLVDALVASSNGDGLVWYEYPGWTKHWIRASGSWTTDMQVGDIDGDGDLDVIIPNANGLQWYENPRPGGDPRTAAWTEHLIGAAGANNHDVELGFVNSDTLLDVVSRRKGGNGTFFWRQESPTLWTQITISTADGEGIGLGDIDHDGDLDVAQNGTWVEQLSPASWTTRDVDPNWPDDVGVLVADINRDGNNDIVLAPSESSGRFSWYEAVDPRAGPWIEHPIDTSVSFIHTFKAFDMDRDGDLDLVTAEMHQSNDPDEVSVYFNHADGLFWEQQVVSEGGSHNVRVADFGGDDDLDIFGANWNDGAPNSAIVEMWENTTAPLPLGQWRRHIIETSLPWRAVFVDGRDINGDLLPDLVLGGWWYPNPGNLGGNWTRTTIGSPLNNLAVVQDFDGDGDADVLGTNGNPSGEDLWWARNDGAGQFALFDVSADPGGGDFLQGASVGQVIPDDNVEVVLSWHNGASGTSLLEVPNDPTDSNWTLRSLSAVTNSEQVPIGDIDADGDMDIHLGSEWLRQSPTGGFDVLAGVTLSAGVPDRVALADLDNDGDLDAAIGVEFSKRLVWGENLASGANWVERLIATDFDYFSVDVADLDRDGDIDVVGGAHMGNGEVNVYENRDNATNWSPHVVDPGDSGQIDHHDGTQLVDMDLDGDLDIVSIGWTQTSVVIYENLALGASGDTTPPTLQSAVSVGNPNLVIAAFSEALGAGSAGNPANYAIAPAIAITAAVLRSDPRSVALTTTTLSEGVSYTLTVNNVADLSGNVVTPDSQIGFEYVEGNLEAGLVGYWPLDEGSGGFTVDATGNGHDGTLVNDPQWTPGAVDFDGIDDYITLDALDVAGSSLTIALWLWAENLANCSSNDCRLLAKATGTAEADHYYMLSTIDSGGETRLRFRLKAGGTTSTLIAGSGALIQGEWLHAAAVYDGSEMRLYLDGILVGAGAKTGAIAPAAFPTWIGGNPSGASDKPWHGMLDEVRLYDRALSAGELLALPPPGDAGAAPTIFADGFEN